MANKKVVKIAEKLESQGTMSFCPGAKYKQVKSFELKNDLELPTQLKQWFYHSDGGEFFLPVGFQLYGVAHKPFIDINENDRPDDSYIVIGTLPNGDPVLCQKTSDQISIYNHEAGKIEDDEIYKDFFSFLNDLKQILGIEEE